MPTHGLAYFPGINQIVDGSIDFTTGITPSRATLTIAPQANFTAQIGTLQFFDGNVDLTWPNARIDTQSFERNSQGLIWRLQILDRRWMWQSWGGGGIVFGGANLCNDDGSLIEATRKTPQEIATACLQAMGETNYDVSQLPNDDLPEILWDGALPASMLQELCEQYGCHVVLSLDNSVKICVVGQGNDLPLDYSVMTNSLSMSIPAMPNRIAAVCAPDLFQCDLMLEAVGIENDGLGTIKPIDQLSYKPSGGWGAVDPQDFGEVLDAKGNKAWRLAKKSVYRYYRVVFPITVVPGYTDTQGNTDAQISNPWQVKILDSQVQTTTDTTSPGDGGSTTAAPQPRQLPAQVFGVFWDEEDGATGNNTDAKIQIYTNDPAVAPTQTNTADGDNEDDTETNDHSWHLGHEGRTGQVKDHLVVFSKPIYALVGGTVMNPVYGPASLCLRTAITILDEYTFSPVRAYFWQDTGSNLDTQPRFECFADLQVTHYFDYKKKQAVDNTSDVQQDANYYIQGLMAEYQATTPQTITYAGLKYIDLNGAINHLHYQVSKRGTTTTASRNNEQIHRVQPLAHRKLMAKIKSALREMKTHRKTLRSHRRSFDVS